MTVSLQEQCSMSAGVLAMAVYVDESGHTTWKLWTGDFFAPGRWSIRGAMGERMRGATQIVQGLRWATLAELLDAGLTEAEALPMLHKSQQPMTATEVLARQQPGPSVELIRQWHKGGVLQWRNQNNFNKKWCDVGTWQPVDIQGAFLKGTEFRRNPAALPDPGTPTPAEIEATQTEQSPEQYVADILADEANKRMLDKDHRPPSERERQYDARKAMQSIDWGALIVDDEPEGLGVIAPIGQRVGSGWWGC